MLIGSIPPITKVEASESLKYGFLVTKREVYAVGKNNFGQLGTKDTKYKKLPVKIHFPKEIVQISSRFDHTLVLDVEGNVFSFGKNNVSFHKFKN